MRRDRNATIDLSALHRDAERNIALMSQLIERVKDRVRRTRELLRRMTIEDRQASR
jgi:hypothetical protein